MTMPVRLVAMARDDDPIAMGMNQEDPLLMVENWGWWLHHAARCDDGRYCPVMPRKNLFLLQTD